MVAGLTLYACCMKAPVLSFFKGFCVGMFFSLLPMVFLIIITPSHWLVYLIVSMLVGLYSLFIIYDTKNIMENYTIDDYIVAAIALYIDII